MKFKAKEWAGFSDAVAQQYGERIEQLIKANGGKVSPADVVKDAKKQASVFHDYFEWDDSKAAVGYRLVQAREIVRGIVTVVKVAGRDVEQRSFYSVTDPTTQAPIYVKMDQVAKNKGYAGELMQRLIIQLDNAKVTIQMLLEFQKR